jgi:hypothetical protein
VLRRIAHLLSSSGYQSIHAAPAAREPFFALKIYRMPDNGKLLD